MSFPYEKLGESIFSIVDQLVPDKDLNAKLKNALDLELIKTNTVPWVDAAVKLLYAIKQFIRPLGALAMTAFGMYAHYKGMSIDPTTHAMIDGAFPAWGVSRWDEKKKGVEKPPKDDWPLPPVD
jgi:hypothetical protein